MDPMLLLEKVSGTYQALLGDRLVGIYLHGSLAMGCFREECSDVDFLVVTSDEPTLNQKQAMIETLLALSPQAPQKGFEMSVVLARDLKPFRYPTPFCLHYSNMHMEVAKRDVLQYCENMRGTDVDLAAHCMITRACGKALIGKPVNEVFGEVPREDYLDSICLDMDNAEQDVSQDPSYVLLNLMRVLAYLKDGEITSKAQGGQWGIENLSGADRQILRQALDAYTTGAPITAKDAELRDFCVRMQDWIKRLRAQ